jgi:hypothetical protein
LQFSASFLLLFSFKPTSTRNATILVALSLQAQEAELNMVRSEKGGEKESSFIFIANLKQGGPK